MNTQSSTIVQRLWNYCNVLRDDGVSYGDYIEQLTYLCFLKLHQENSTMLGKHTAIPEQYNWASLQRLNGDELESYYREILTGLGQGAALMIFTLMNMNTKYAGSSQLSRLGQGNFNESMVLSSFTEAAQSLIEHFGRVDVKWGDVNRLMRGAVDPPIGGGPDTCMPRMEKSKKTGACRSRTGIPMCCW